MKRYARELRWFAVQKFYLLSLVVTAAISFGHAALNPSVSIDDLESIRYVGSGNEMLAAGRFGIVLWARLFGYTGALVEKSLTIDLLAMVMLIATAINFCILIRRIAGERISASAYLVFSCLFLSYPLMNEIWEYTGANLCVCAGYLCVSWAVLLMWNQLHGKLRLVPTAAAALLVMLACASYESLAAVYIFAVFAVLGLQVIFGPEEEKALAAMFRQGLHYAAVLAAGVALRFVVAAGIRMAMGLAAQSNGATEIAWGQESAGHVLASVLFKLFLEYVWRGIVYLPITELVIAGIVFLVLGVHFSRKTSRTLWLPWLGMLLSMVVLSFLQGTVTPYRACQVFALFISLTALLTMAALAGSCRRAARPLACILTALGLVLSLSQSLYLRHFLVWNHQRSEEEAVVVREIGAALESVEDSEKPVIFTGSYTLSNSVRDAVSIPETSLRWRIYWPVQHALTERFSRPWYAWYSFDDARKLPSTNVNSVLDWALHAFGSQESMARLFAYYGYDYSPADYDAVLPLAREYVVAHGVARYPDPGYLVDAGDYIIVNL